MNIFIFINFYYNIIKNEPQYKLKKVTQGIKSIKDVLCTLFTLRQTWKFSALS